MGYRRTTDPRREAMKQDSDLTQEFAQRAQNKSNMLYGKYRKLRQDLSKEERQGSTTSQHTASFAMCRITAGRTACGATIRKVHGGKFYRTAAKLWTEQRGAWVSFPADPIPRRVLRARDGEVRCPTRRNLLLRLRCGSRSVRAPSCIRRAKTRPQSPIIRGRKPQREIGGGWGVLQFSPRPMQRSRPSAPHRAASRARTRDSTRRQVLCDAATAPTRPASTTACAARPATTACAAPPAPATAGSSWT